MLNTICVFAAAASLTMTYLVFTGRLNPKIEYLATTEITAHRGASAERPENTMAAFTRAYELGADWIELDVQQTADGKIIVMHDANLKRTCGVNAACRSLTYEEISKLDAGSYFSREYAGEPVPLLSEAIEFAIEKDIRLNIELKPTGKETAFEQSVIDIIHAYDFAEKCVITSQVYSVLEKVKEIDPDLQTVYVMKLAYGKINKLTAADHFSVDAMNVTRGLLQMVHNEGKQVYVWTVNSKSTLDRMLDMGVDNIITDDIPMVQERIYKDKFTAIVEPLEDEEIAEEIEQEMQTEEKSS